MLAITCSIEENYKDLFNEQDNFYTKCSFLVLNEIKMRVFCKFLNLDVKYSAVGSPVMDKHSIQR